MPFGNLREIYVGRPSQPFFLATLALAACGGSAFDDLNDTTPQGSAFQNALYKNYILSGALLRRGWQILRERRSTRPNLDVAGATSTTSVADLAELLCAESGRCGERQGCRTGRRPRRQFRCPDDAQPADDRPRRGPRQSARRCRARPDRLRLLDYECAGGFADGRLRQMPQIARRLACAPRTGCRRHRARPHRQLDEGAPEAAPPAPAPAPAPAPEAAPRRPAEATTRSISISTRGR